MITLMSAAGLVRADWYALREEGWFPNAGLYAGGAARPVLDTFRLAQQKLLAAGNARRIDTGDPLVFAREGG